MSYSVILVVDRKSFVDRSFSTMKEAEDYKRNLLNLPERDRHFDSVEIWKDSPPEPPAAPGGAWH